LFFLRKPPAPRITADKYSGVGGGANAATVTLYPGLGLKVYYATNAAPVKGAGGTTEYTGPFRITAAGQLRVKAMTLLGIESEESFAVFT
jgi:hypothetical protein